MLLEQYIKFAMGVSFTTKTAKRFVEEAMEEICNPLSTIEVDGHIYYAVTRHAAMNGRRVYYHVYFDPERQLNESNVFMHRVLKLEKRLMSGEVKMTDPEAQKYFSFHKNKEGTYNIHRKEDIIRKENRLSGYFLILTNDSRDSEYILEIYRSNGRPHIYWIYITYYHVIHLRKDTCEE